MGKLFGTDGIRGVVGETLTAELAYHVGCAVTTVLTDRLGHKPVITLGKDTRISSDMLESALMAGICSAGGDVMPLGTIPTPAVAFLTVQEHADAGIVISASHNPYEHNGIKVFNGQGYKLSDEMEAAVEDLILYHTNIPVKTHGEIGTRYHGMRQMKKDYIHHLYSTVDCDLTGLRVLVDCANGAASATAPQLFGMLPIQADFIHTEPDGININTNCGSTHLDSLAEHVVAGGYDLGIAFDGDADRCLLVDEKGNTIDGDKIMAVCATELRRQGKLTDSTVVGTVMSNLGLHEFCQKNGMVLVCTDVGDRHVLEEMVAHNYVIGGEQSGHMIFRQFATTGDGELTALQFLQALKKSGLPASQLASCCPQYPQVLVNVSVPVDAKQRIMTDETMWAKVRGREEALGDDGRILIRPSGTEALIRVMVEAKTTETATHVANELAEYITTLA